MNPIEIEHLFKTFRVKKGRKVEALKDVALTVLEGEVFGFLGPNGAGKSTMIKVLVGLIKPTSGMARLYNLPTGAPSARINIGYLPENPMFYDFLTAREYLDLVGRTFRMSTALIRDKSKSVLEYMDLTDAAHRPIRSYSKGMVQRLGLAQTLLHDPDLFILDEPMSGLDPVGRALVKQLILDLKSQGKTIFFSTHVISDVEAVCDRVGIIASGTLRAIYDVEAVMQSGIEGYAVQIRGCSVGSLAEYNPVERSEGRLHAVVSREKFQDFMRRLSASGGFVELIEPQRRSLESLFLEIVRQTR